MTTQQKLTDRAETDICARYLTTRNQILAREYGVSRSTIRNILLRRGVKMKPKHVGNKYDFDTHFFDSIDTEEKAYVLGFIYADGCLYEPHHKMAIELNERDRDILLKIQKVMKSNHPLHPAEKDTRSGNRYRYLGLTMANHHFFAACLKQGLAPRKSLTLRFPTSDQVPDHLIHHFIRGYFDGDGSLTVIMEPYRRVGVSIIGTRSFCESLKEVVDRNLGNCLGSVIPNKMSPKTTYYRTGSRPHTEALLRWLYQDATIYLDRKYTKYQHLLSVSRTLGRQRFAASKFFGVQKYRGNRFVASVHLRGTGKSKQLGVFDREEDAARAYDTYCLIHGLNLSKLNSP